MITKTDRILVTGACGSVGAALVKELLKIGCTVCAFDNSEDKLFLLDQEIDKLFKSNNYPNIFLIYNFCSRY